MSFDEPGQDTPPMEVMKSTFRRLHIEVGLTVGLEVLNISDEDDRLIPDRQTVRIGLTSPPYSSIEEH